MATDTFFNGFVVPSTTLPTQHMVPVPSISPRVGPTFLVKNAWMNDELRDLVRNFNPKTQLGRLIKLASRYCPEDVAADLIESICRTVVVESQLSLVAFNYDAPGIGLQVSDYGIVSRKVVTTAGVNKIVALMNTTDAVTGAAFKFHSMGTGTTAEAIGDTALVTELTTEYNPNSTRATGTQTVGGSNNIYSTVATNTLDSGTPAVTEIGLHSAASAGTLLDRFKFSAVNLTGANGDGIQSTIQITFAAGG